MIEQSKPDIKEDRSPKLMTYSKSSEHKDEGQDRKQGLLLHKASAVPFTLPLQAWQGWQIDVGFVQKRATTRCNHKSILTFSSLVILPCSDISSGQ